VKEQRKESGLEYFKQSVQKLLTWLSRYAAYKTNRADNAPVNILECYAQ
jgi:hypothetical protein